MAKVRELNIALGQEMAGAFAAAIATGDYADDAAIVSVALAQWQRRQAEHIAYLRQAWADGIASGPPIEGNFDLEDIKRRGAERLTAARSAG